MPETFLPRCEVDFTMPLATMSNTVVRSVSIEQHEDSDRVEKFVRYVAKCQYKVEIDYIQCADLEVDTMDPSINPDTEMATVPELHQPAFQPAGIAQLHDGYRIDFHESETGLGRKDDSSSDEDEEKAHKMPIIQIDMKNYGY
uniref:MHD domain-containing protein n=1 Tax=Heterorhabditis bacteriophora TaxID=37862 RepID=A0A1I7XFC1_HETBA